MYSSSSFCSSITSPPLAEAPDGHANRKRKRTKSDDNDDLESKYLDKIAGGADHPKKDLEKDPEEAKSDSSGPGDNGEDDSEDDAEPIVHESLSKVADEDGIEKASRTVFLSNVSTDAITSRTAKKALLSHLASIFDESATPKPSVESLRFRSVPFATASMPKRAWRSHDDLGSGAGSK